MTHNEFAEMVCAKLGSIGGYGIDDVRNAIHECLHNVRLESESTDLVTVDADRRGLVLRKFVACKMVEGCTQKTLSYYKSIVQKFAQIIQKQFCDITTDDVRYYLAVRTQEGVSKCTLNNERRILSSFFAWMTASDEISRNPMLLIKNIKCEKRVKKPFSDMEIERLRIAAQGDIRATAILEILLSTGMRVGELNGLNREDVNDDEVIVFGKGQKERICYLNARSQVALKMYLESRNDDNEAMFISQRSPYKRLKIHGIEDVVRDLSERSGVPNVHPHRFRRTAATMALNRGMPIDQVQQMLGHEQIATTLIYAKAANDTVKQSHKKYMG